ncbi:hypothetical protein B2G47_17350 [Leptospira interrogans serovar Canicola]|nr:hypothetical protein B2G47_17350 [Leptospira interrogans serovar Canicola]
MSVALKWIIETVLLISIIEFYNNSIYSIVVVLKRRNHLRLKIQNPKILFKYNIGNRIHCVNIKCLF